MAPGKATAIGIDLGTTYSCVGVFQYGKVEIIANDQGNRTTPSYVAFTDRELLVGDAAKNQIAMNSKNTVFAVKRLIGRRFTDKIVQEDMKHWPFKVINQRGKPAVQVEYMGEERILVPEEISSMVLTKMKETAEAYLDQKVTDAVITVPAYFNDAQRQATKDAGEIAGLNVLRIINEPTAAALAYGLQKKVQDRQHVLVFDLGGGTFDVSVLLVDDGIFEVLATAGDTHLGGEDFDNRMVNNLVREFQRKRKKNFKNNPRALQRLRTAVERSKRSLSGSSHTSIVVDSLFDGIDFRSDITRARFENLCSDLFKKCLAPVDKAIVDAKIKMEDIDTVLMVGGSTRIPKIQKLIREHLDGKDLNKSINPDEAVAYGAAIQAAILSGDESEEIQDVVLVDVTPLSLGIEITGGGMSTVIERNTTIPAKVSRPYTTHADNVISLDIMVYQGEGAITKDNNLLGEFTLNGIPPAPRGVPKIEVTFDIDDNGILTVTALDKSTGCNQNITITDCIDCLTKEEIEAMINDAEKHKAEDELLRERFVCKNRLENYVYKVKSALKEPAAQRNLTPEDKQTITDVVDDVIHLLDLDSKTTKKEYMHQLTKLQNICSPILSKMYVEKEQQNNAPPAGPVQPQSEERDNTESDNTLLILVCIGLLLLLLNVVYMRLW
ncbi:heat shock 70 kDa protein IV-like [Diadema antillarum]|uniref:heat shock 70 kDa protein IV-like n=1 Tax=Diadema antillarum TaxID=105358 RepID=UPI003A87E191